MRQIAIECSGVGGSVAILGGSVVLASTTLEEKPGTARTLAAAIRNLLNSHPGRPDFISVTNGPGSFTGLRVGLATAKTLAYAWNIPIVSVNSLSVVAHQGYVHLQNCSGGPSKDACIVVLMNAFRKQLFVAAFENSGFLGMDKETPRAESNSARNLGFVASTQIVDVSAWQHSFLHSLKWNCAQPADSEVFVSGPGIAAAGGGGPLNLLPQSIWNPNADSLGQIAYEAFVRGETTTAVDLLPNYIRGSAAEENKKDPA